jgi:hypothetical protein
MNICKKISSAWKYIILIMIIVFYSYLIISALLPSSLYEGFNEESSYDSVMKKIYQPLQVKCTKKDCDYAQSVMDNSFNLDPSLNYFDDGWRECNADICSTINRLSSTMKQIDASGGYFKDTSGNIYNYLGVEKYSSM